MYIDYLNKIKDKQDRLLLSKIIDKYNTYIKTGKSTSSSFLNEYEYNFVVNSLKYLNIDFNIYKVNSFCDKLIIYFGSYNDFVHVYKIKGIFEHKDILGTLFSIGYSFDMIGDIIIDKDYCYLTNLSKYDSLLKDLVMIKNQRIELEQIDNFNIDRDKYIKQEIIIPSMRLDVIVGKLCNLSRSKSQEFIKDKKVLLNYKEIVDIKINIKSSDIISIRGYGKYKIGNQILYTKKDNILLEIFKYN